MLPMNSVDIRDRLVEVLRQDLVGPASPEEILNESPSHFYLTGFLVPFEGSEEDRMDPDSDDDIDASCDAGDGDADGTSPEKASARKVFLPASLGVSVLLPPGTHALEISAAWGDYERQKAAVENDSLDEANTWRRVPRIARKTIHVGPNPAAATPVQLETNRSGPGVELMVLARPRPDAEGTAVTLFLVNRRGPDRPRDKAFVFQASLSVDCSAGFVERPNLRGRDDGTNEHVDFDELVADLQYRDCFEFAVGHGVSTTARLDPDRVCRHVETVWIPTAQVEKVVPAADVGLPKEHLEMEFLGQTEDFASILRPLPAAYRQWIEEQSRTHFDVAMQGDVCAELMREATQAAQRIEDGIEALEDEKTALAFRFANRAMAAAARARRPKDVPSWRPFQIAFVLMNIAGIVHGQHEDRKLVDLLFFPTGGGKTEAYLGLAAFTLVYRRLHHEGIRGAGVSVIMRYTLRLLTLDQLERATAMICALEIMRKTEKRLGPWPFEIGLWVGRGATPNRMGKKGQTDPESAREKTRAYLNRKSKTEAHVPIPIERCPWCGTEFAQRSFRLAPNDDAPTQLEVRCMSASCAWSGDKPLPIVAVDEPLYRRLPCFLIATVDKFAQLPWVGETGALFGRVSRYDNAGFYGPCDDVRIGKALPGGHLPPPDLIIQDELHLISGPLGTMVGLYETAIDALCEDESGARPKIVASTATVRRAKKQIRALYARQDTVIFPSPGPNRRDSFFARTVPVPPQGVMNHTPTDENNEYANARRYIGVAAQGRSLKVTMLRTYLALLAGAQKMYWEQGGHENPNNPAAPYMTLLGYFNSLRELGGGRRIVEDEVTQRLGDYDLRKRHGDPRPPFASRSIGEVVELTSRVSTVEVAAVKRRLDALPHEREKGPVDVALATNMISVGLDITRLGLMVVLGQPKTTAEYIQSTSRVGRDHQRPGLVVTLLNVHRPRDRSHYERFEAYHESFYRAVEATSVTPFSPRAVDRAAPAVTVALARLLDARLTPNEGASRVDGAKATLERVHDVFGARVRAALTDEELAALPFDVQKVITDLTDSWSDLARRKREIMPYTPRVGGEQGLLYEPLDKNPPKDSDNAKFKAQRSMREVEPNVNLYLQIPDLAKVGA